MFDFLVFIQHTQPPPHTHTREGKGEPRYCHTSHTTGGEEYHDHGGGRGKPGTWNI